MCESIRCSFTSWGLVMKLYCYTIIGDCKSCDDVYFISCLWVVVLSVPSCQLHWWSVLTVLLGEGLQAPHILGLYYCLVVPCCDFSQKLWVYQLNHGWLRHKCRCAKKLWGRTQQKHFQPSPRSGTQCLSVLLSKGVLQRQTYLSWGCRSIQELNAGGSVKH